MSIRRAAGLAAFALVVGGAAVPASADTVSPPPQPGITLSLPGISLSLNTPVPAPVPSVGALEATLLTKLNAERAAAGLGALALQSWASSVARAHSLEMAAARDIWHNHAGYLDVAKKAVGAYLTGENVAEAGTLDEADSLLMNSPPHRANILYPAFNYVGIGVALDSAGYVYVTQDFVTIRPAPAAQVAAAKTPSGPTGTLTRAPAGKAAPTPAAPSPSSPPVAATPAVAAAAVPTASPGTATPAAAVLRAAPAPPRAAPAAAAPVPRLSPLAASPVVATSYGVSLPAVAWAIALAALAGVVHAWVVRRRPGRRSGS